MVALNVLPDCFGTHEEGHPDCDGDASAEDVLAQRPCGVREICVGSRAGMHDVRPEKPALCGRDARTGPCTLPANHRGGCSPTGKRRTQKLHRKDPPSDGALAVFAWFRERLADELGATWADHGQAPVPGQLVEIDHFDTRRYVLVNFRTEDTAVPVARVYLSSRSPEIGVGFPAEVDEARQACRRAVVSGLRVETRADGGKFRSWARDCERGRAGAAARLSAYLLRQEVPLADVG